MSTCPKACDRWQRKGRRPRPERRSSPTSRAARPGEAIGWGNLSQLGGRGQAFGGISLPLPLRGEVAGSLQRIILGARNTRGAVSCGRVGASSLRKGELLHARTAYQPRKGIVSLVAARLVIDSVRLLALPDELLRDRPWLRPHGRIVNRDHVFEGSRPDPRPALDQMQVLARALKIRLRAE